MKLEVINYKHKITLGGLPIDADLAIVSIDSKVNLGQLNESALLQYGYTAEDLPNKEIIERNGFGAIPNTKGKAIIFISTIDKFKNRKETLEENLYNALSEYRSWFKSKIVWLQLMDTDSGGLKVQESYNASAKAYNKFQKKYPTDVLLNISFPATADGKSLYELIINNSTSRIKTVERFLRNLNCKFYLVDYRIHDGGNLSESFFKENSWRREYYNEEYDNIFYEIKKGDIFILKTIINSSDGENKYMRIIGLGIVTNEENYGPEVSVDWRVKNLKINIPEFKDDHETIAKINLDGVTQIFLYVNPIHWEKLTPLPIPPVVIASRIASLFSDADIGVDYLNISKDVTAFARVVAAKSFEPPLAIALFGKWGSGKSFFMRKLKEQVEILSEKNANNMYCEGVVHIHFNAWSYLDANLWASFVSKIFEGLNEYITENSLSDIAKNEIEAELNSSLNIAKEEMQILENRKNVIQNQIKLLEEKREILEKELKKKTEELQKKTAWDIINETDKEFKAKEKIIESLEKNSTYVKTEEELRKIIPEKYWNEPEEAYRQISSKYTFLKEFFRRGSAWKNLRWTFFILFIILFIPILLELSFIQISKINFTIPQVGLSFLVMLSTVWKRAEIIYKKLQPVVASFWKIKVDYEKKNKEALAKFYQEEKAMKLEIETSKDELKSIKEQIQKAETIKVDIEFKIKHAISTEALYSFIEKRSKSDDYQKHLGIISIIRRDFEILNDLFSDHQDEFITREKGANFRSKFKKPLERIILYIDDLDRCPEDNVVQVLEAVNLLMAFPLFIVIVGVDQRWVKNALIKNYVLQFTGKLKGSFDMKTGVELIEPSDYLEKIFQVPFHLKDAPKQNVREMIKQLAISKPLMTKTSTTTTIGNIINPDAHQNKYEEFNTEHVESKIKITENNILLKDEFSNEHQEKIEFLELSSLEVELLQDMGDIVGPNPRALKRFVNIYKIIKAHEDYSVGEDSDRDDLFAVLSLLALASGHYKSLISDFETFNLSSFAPERKMSEYLDGGLKDADYSNLKASLKFRLSGNANLNEILEIKQSTFNNHQPFIKRFTF